MRRIRTLRHSRPSLTIVEKCSDCVLFDRRICAPSSNHPMSWRLFQARLIDDVRIRGAMSDLPFGHLKHPFAVPLPSLSRALTASKTNGPTLYDLCDPLLRGAGGGNAHLRKFYGTAIANPLLRPLLGRAGLPQLRDASLFDALRDALPPRATRSRRTGSPSAGRWPPCSIGFRSAIRRADRHRPRRRPDRGARPHHPRLRPASARHVRQARLHPRLRGIQLIGDPDFRGSDLLIALQGSMPAATRTPRCCSISRAHSSPARRQAAVLNRPGAAWPSKCGRRCRSAIARPTTTHSTPRR